MARGKKLAPPWREHDALIARRTLPADLARVAELSGDLHAACKEAGLDEIACMDLELAVVEAANNVVVHGYRGDADAHYAVCIEARSGAVEVILTDRGRPIPKDCLSGGIASDSDESGRGLLLIRQCVDELVYTSSDGENRLTLRKQAAL